MCAVAALAMLARAVTPVCAVAALAMLARAVTPVSAVAALAMLARAVTPVSTVAAPAMLARAVTPVCAVAALAMLAGCGGGGAAGAAGAAAYAGAQAVVAAARRASGGCYTPCTHDTHCDRSTGLCEPGPEAPRPQAAPARTSGGHARPALASAAATDFDCALPDGEHDVVQAHSRAGARDVCLAWNDVGDAAGACVCEPAPVAP